MRKIASVAVLIVLASLSVACAIVFVFEPTSIVFRYLLSGALLLGGISCLAVLLSLQRFMNERRELGRKLLYEVRIHRAETKLLQRTMLHNFDSINERADSDKKEIATELGKIVLSESDLSKSLADHRRQIKRSLANNQKPATLDDAKLISIQSDLKVALDLLEKSRKMQQNMLPTLSKQYLIRTKQLLSVIEASSDR